MSVCLFAAIYRKFQMSEFKYSMKTERRFVHASMKLLPERSIGVKDAQGMKTTQVNARMAIADHDIQGQASHRRYKSWHGQQLHNRHS